jgi:DHA1 family tetracycline resistance protein-like MFS transporter
MSKKSFSQKRAILSIFLVLVVNACGMGLVLPQLAPMLFSHQPSSILSDAVSHYARHWYYGIAVSLPVIFMFVGSPFWGAISDSIGRKKILTIAILGQMVAMITAAVGIHCHIILLFLFAQAFIGLIDASESTAQAAMIDISEPSQVDKTKNISLVSLAFALGFIIGPILGGFLSDSSLVSWFNYTTPFFAAALLSSVNLVILLCWFQETYQIDNMHRPSITTSITEMFTIFKHRKILYLAAVFLCMQITWSLFFESISLFLLTWFNYSPKNIGLFMVAVSVSFSFSLLVILRLLLKRLSPRYIICIGFILILSGAVMDVFYTKELVVWLSILPMTSGAALIYNTVLVCLSSMVNIQQQGRVMGLSITISATAFALAAVLMGVAAHIDMKIIFILMGLSSLIGLSLILFKKIQVPQSNSYPPEHLT